MIIRDELELIVTHASALAVSCPAATLQRKPLLTSDERQQRRAKPPTHEQSCNCLTTQTAHEASPLGHTTYKGKNWQDVYEFFDSHDSAMRSNSHSTASLMLVWPSMKPLRVHELLCFIIDTNVRNDYSRLCEVQMNVHPKWKVTYHLPCTNLKPNGQRIINNVHYGAWARDDVKVSCWWVHNDYKLQSIGIVEGPWRLFTFFPMRPRRR